MTVISVPNKELPVKLVASRNEQLIIVRESEIRHRIIVLRKSENGLLLVVVPNHDI